MQLSPPITILALLAVMVAGTVSQRRRSAKSYRWGCHLWTYMDTRPLATVCFGLDGGGATADVYSASEVRRMMGVPRATMVFRAPLPYRPSDMID